METILLVDDDKVLRYMLREGLEKNDFLIVEAVNGARSLEILKHHKTDLILLDLNLPDGSGLDFIKQIRAYTDVPVIIISGEHQAEFKINGFAFGADDYVTKPFDLNILIARIKSHIRRYKGQVSNQNRFISTEQNVAFIGGLKLDREKFQLYDDNNQSCNLTSREYNLLNVLLEHAGRVIRRDELCDAIREDSYIPTPRAIDVKITRIRKKLNDHAENPQIIKTVRGVGYVFEPAALTSNAP